MSRTNDREAVVLVHGWWFSTWTLVPLARRLEARGFEAHRFGYHPSRRSFEENAERLNDFVASLGRPRVHLVGHSLGGLLIRALFNSHPRQPPGRIVTLGAPHRGSFPATRVAGWPLGERLLGRSVLELVQREFESWRPPEREIGVIAGDLSIGIGRLVPGLPRPNDGVVPLDESHLPGAVDTLTIRTSHSAMLLSPTVARQVAQFLRTGRFEHGPTAVEAPHL